MTPREEELRKLVGKTVRIEQGDFVFEGVLAGKVGDHLDDEANAHRWVITRLDEFANETQVLFTSHGDCIISSVS